MRASAAAEEDSLEEGLGAGLGAAAGIVGAPMLFPDTNPIMTMAAGGAFGAGVGSMLDKDREDESEENDQVPDDIFFGEADDSVPRMSAEEFFDLSESSKKDVDEASLMTID